jgi:hypothetical protein
VGMDAFHGNDAVLRKPKPNGGAQGDGCRRHGD